jgi:hypothetical protein
MCSLVAQGLVYYCVAVDSTYYFHFLFHSLLLFLFDCVLNDGMEGYIYVAELCWIHLGDEVDHLHIVPPGWRLNNLKITTEFLMV